MTDERLAQIAFRHTGIPCDAAHFESCELLAALKAERQRVVELEKAFGAAMEPPTLGQPEPASRELLPCPFCGDAGSFDSDDSGTMSKRAIQHKASRQDKAYKLEQWRLAGARIAAAAAISGRGAGQEPRKSED